MKSVLCLCLLIVLSAAIENSQLNEEGVIRIQGSTKNTKRGGVNQSEENVIRIQTPTEGAGESIEENDENVHRIQGSMEGTECEACNFVIESFKLGMKRTRQSHFGGGDGEWEKKKNYTTSEIRFVEIQEKLCLEMKYPDQARCLDLAERHEKYLKKWWGKVARKRDIDMFDSVCVKATGLCPPVTTEKPKKCGKGYYRNVTDYTCTDVDECENGEASCKHGEWCLNVNGSFYCLACHPHCDGCTGGGLHKCTNQRYSTRFEFIKMHLGLEWVEPGHILLGFYLCIGIFSSVFLLVLPKFGAIGIVISVLLYFLVYPFPPTDT